MLNVRSSKGFTLLEMMAVCVILTILAGIIMPNIARRIDYAKMIRTVQSQLAQNILLGHQANC